jgi:mono/diheme cytochrome c family protein
MTVRVRRRRWLSVVAGGGAVLVAVGLVVAWLLSTGPTDFAGGNQVALTDYTAGDPTGVPISLRNAPLIARGRYLAQVADCTACHTREGGAAFAGGRAFRLPFGMLYSTNITADPDTGIGSYTDRQFIAAVRNGVRRDGEALYPAMPFASYTYMTDADVLAVKAYLFSLPPVRSAALANTLEFPVNRRGLMALWSNVFVRDERFAPHADRTPEWNRGAYLVEAMAHCGECHTPRTPFQTLYQRAKFAGAVQAGWHAINISSDRDAGIGAWTADELTAYLVGGHSGHGSAAGPMGEVVDLSLQHLSPEDIAAMVTYLRSVPPTGSGERPKRSPASVFPVADATHPVGRRVYAQTCAGCHEWSGVSLLSSNATLIGTRAANDPSALNVAQIILGGGRLKPGGELSMPDFGSVLSDFEVAETANYVTARFGHRGAALSERDVAVLRQGR